MPDGVRQTNGRLTLLIHNKFAGRMTKEKARADKAIEESYKKTRSPKKASDSVCAGKRKRN